MRKSSGWVKFIGFVLTLFVMATAVSCARKSGNYQQSGLGDSGCSSSESSEQLAEKTTEGDRSSVDADQFSEDVFEGNLILTALKVGAADAFVLQKNGHVTVIDTATDKKADEVVTFLTDQNITKIDELIITHFDKDHVGGADKLIDAFDIGCVYTTYRSKDSDDIAEYDAAMSAKGLTETVVSSVLTYEAEGVSYTIYPPKSLSYQEKESNNSSLAVKVVYGSNSVLFAGDAESERISELLNTRDLSCTILKVPHHGRFNDLSEAFINYVHPTYAIITSSKDEPEDERVLTALNSIGAQVFITREGTVTFIITPDSITVSQNGR